MFLSIENAGRAVVSDGTCSNRMRQDHCAAVKEQSFPCCLCHELLLFKWDHLHPHKHTAHMLNYNSAHMK